MPSDLYVLEVCNIGLYIDKRLLQSFDFTVNRFFMKLFRTSNIEIVYCQTVFGCELLSVLLVKGMRNSSINLHVALFSCLVKLFYFSVLL